MTIVIKKGDSKEVMQKKLSKLPTITPAKSEKTFSELCGSLKGVFKEDAVKLQRKWRSEWR